MAEVPKRYFERFFVLGGFAFIAFLFWGAYWMQNGRKLQLAEKILSSRFTEFIIYKENKYLSNVNILSPNGDFVSVIGDGRKYTVLNIWKTTCSPCVKNLMSLNRLNEVLPYELAWRVIAVSVDDNNNLPNVSKFASHFKVGNIANYNDYNFELQKHIDVSRLPMTLILNKSGRILYELRGAKLWHDRTMVDFLDLVRKVH